MYQGKTNQVAKVWGVIGGAQISEIPAGATVKGDAPSGGYAYIYTGTYNGKTWKAGFTKTAFLTGYSQIVVVPPDPPATTKTPFTLNVTGYKPYSGELEKE